MTNENVWFENRKKIIKNNIIHDKVIYFSSLWIFLFIPIYLFLKYYIFKIHTPLASIVGTETVLILFLLIGFGPNILLTQIFSYKKISDEDSIRYHLYNISRKLESLAELPELKKEIYESLYAINETIQINKGNKMFFSKNIDNTIHILQEGLERTNTYIKHGPNLLFNLILASNLRRIADCIRKDNSKISDDLSNAINQLNSSFIKIAKTKINVPSYKKLLDEFKKRWNEMPSSLKLTSIIILIFMFIWFIPVKMGLDLDDNYKLGAVVVICVPFITSYIKELRLFSRK